MHIPWEPAIYEHKAALLGQRPAAVASSAAALADAVLREHELYQADYLTVGLDVYNLEAEALGARLTVPSDHACPDLVEPLYTLDNLPATLATPAIPAAGRCQLLLDAGRRVRDALAGRARVRVAASGPVTMAAKLVGVEPLILSLVMEDGAATRLLEFTTTVAQAWCGCLRENGLEVILFDSMAAPPILSPDLYAQFALPLHQRLMRGLEQSGQAERELVIGGDTVPLLPSLLRSGANILLCDYAADARAFRAALGDDRALTIRRNLNPRELDGGDMAALATRFLAELTLFSHPLAGTGILPYDFNPARLREFQQELRRAAQARPSC